MAAIRALLGGISAALTELTDAFYYAFRRQWMKENKPQGFDVQDIRIGALLLRLRHCRERLEDYAAGRISTIEAAWRVRRSILSGAEPSTTKGPHGTSRVPGSSTAEQ